MSVPYSYAGPALGCVAITPSDATDLPDIAIGILVTAAGTAKITDAKGNVSTSVPLQMGYNAIAIRRMWATGTTATGMFALYGP